MPGCKHSLGQIDSDVFECSRCRMIFPGIDRRNPNAHRMVDDILRGGIIPDSFYHDPRMPHGSPITVKHVDLGPVPSMIDRLGDKVLEQEGTLREIKTELSRFVDILKIAVEK